MKLLRMKWMLLTDLVDKKPDLFTMGNGVLLSILSIFQGQSLGTIAGILVFLIGSIYTIKKQRTSWRKEEDERLDIKRNKDLAFTIKLKNANLNLKDLASGEE